MIGDAIRCLAGEIRVAVTHRYAATADGAATDPGRGAVGPAAADHVGRTGKATEGDAGWLHPQCARVGDADFQSLVVGGAEELCGRVGAGVAAGAPQACDAGKVIAADAAILADPADRRICVAGVAGPHLHLGLIDLRQPDSTVGDLRATDSASCQLGRRHRPIRQLRAAHSRHADFRTGHAVRRHLCGEIRVAGVLCVGRGMQLLSRQQRGVGLQIIGATANAQFQPAIRASERRARRVDLQQEAAIVQRDVVEAERPGDHATIARRVVQHDLEVIVGGGAAAIAQQALVGKRLGLRWCAGGQGQQCQHWQQGEGGAG